MLTPNAENLCLSDLRALMKLTADGPNINFGMQFKRQQLHCHHLPLLALQDSDLDPSQTPLSIQI